MTVQQQIVWTALPNGVAGRALRLSVLVAPRLRTDEHGSRPTLAAFPDFVDWPAMRVGFRVRIDDRPPVDAQRSPLPADASAVWRSLFPPTTFVRPHTFDDLADRPVRSYSPFVIDGFARSLFRATADRPTEPVDLGVLLPRLFPAAREQSDSLAERFASLGVQRGHRTRTANRIESELRSSPRRALGTRNAPLDNFLLRQRFLARSRSERRRPAPAPEVPDIDFHQTLGLLGDHPALLRHLGLVVDLLAPVAAFGRDLPTSAAVTVEPVYPLVREPVSRVQTSPVTRTVLSPVRFEPEPEADSVLAGGHVAVGRTARFSVTTVDAEHAAQTLELFTDGLARSTSSAPALGRAVLPSLKTAGVQVSQRSHAVRLATRLVRTRSQNARLEASEPIELSADDLYRGFRPDIWDEATGRWFSLVARRVEYRLTADGRVLAFDDEAIVAPAITQDPDGSSDLYLGETLLTWRGWSLAAPKPGVPISADELPGDDGFPEAPNTAVAGVPLEITPRVRPGTLPRLRFGRRYRVRLRAVDLAGNSRPLSLGAAPGDPELTSALFAYRRQEPVPSPVLLHRRPKTVTETVDRVVVRSSDFTGPGERTEVSSRHVVVPKTSQQVAEEHGRFDTAADGRPLDKAAYGLIVARENENFDAIATTDPADPGDSYVDRDLVAAPYLPDPLARGASFVGLPNRPDPMPLLVPLGDDSTWPSYRPLRLDVRQGDAAPVHDDASSTLTVSVPTGHTVAIRVGCHLRAEDLDTLGVYEWLLDATGDDRSKVAQLRLAALTGLVPTLTPSRRLVLVHAVRQPVRTPEFVEPGVGTRRGGDTAAVLVGDISLHGQSTGRLDLLGSWSEWVDRGPGTAPPVRREVDRTFVAVIPSERVEGARQSDVASLQTTHEFGDTRHRTVRYHLLATTRYVEEFRRRHEGRFSARGELALPDLGQGIVPSTVRLRLVGRPDLLGEGTDFTVPPDGSPVLQRVDGGQIPPGASVEADYVAGPITRESEPFEGTVRSSARPAAPAVRDVTPVFTWTRSVSVGGRLQLEAASTRTSNTLRVLLDRPWYTSGDGELLGVVLYPAPTRGVPPGDELHPYVSLWGEDPTVPTRGLPSSSPGAEELPATTTFRSGLSVPGTASRVDVAGHEVAYDAERDLWYCDVVLDVAEAYLPFVRLALARFQPNSIDDAQLSSVVLAPTVQLPPRRRTTVAGTLDPRRFDVTVSGGSLSRRPQAPQPDRARVVVEQSLGEAAGDAQWREVSSQPMALGAFGGFATSVVLPSAPTPGRFRLAVEQFEVVPTQDQDSSDLAERLVYLDTVDLPLLG